LPETTLLNHPEEVKLHLLGDDTAALAKMIQETLRSFRVEAEVRPEDISIGPTVIRFGIRPTGKPEMKMDEKSGKMVFVKDGSGNIVYESRTRVSRIMALQNDLALVLEAKTIRMEAPVPGRPYVGVEIPNKNSRLVTLREVLESKEYQAAKAKSRLAIVLGRDVAGQVRVGDLARMPHLLIAGATGAGKSVCINTIIASILTQATPDDVRMLMVDPKMVELNMYNGIPHLLSPVVTEVDKVVSLLKNAISEMERRYRLFSQLNVRNLDGYRKLRTERMLQGDTSLSGLPAIVIIIDELADLMMAAPEEVEGMICRLAQLARATGMHLVIATQRPSVDVITGLIKANIPTRISFMVSSAVDSRTIIDMGGAERLLGRGDMLYLPADAGRPERIQGAFLADDEAEKLVEYWRQQAAQRAIQAGSNGATPTVMSALAAVEPGWEIKEEPEDEFELDDDLLDEAEEVVRDFGKASISLLQRRLRIGYSRAARLIDLLEERGIIGQAEQGGRAREVLDERNGVYDRRVGNGHTLADEAADILAEEKARNEFLRKQAAAGKSPQQWQSSDDVEKEQ
jgi:DNA segregation ATPase FtsK/SpoIIIE-like protein